MPVVTTKRLRERAGLTQIQLADLLGVSARTVQRADLEAVDAPGVPWFLAQLAHAVGWLDGPLPAQWLEGGRANAWRGVLSAVAAARGDGLTSWLVPPLELAQLAAVAAGELADDCRRVERLHRTEGDPREAGPAVRRVLHALHEGQHLPEHARLASCEDFGDGW